MGDVLDETEGTPHNAAASAGDSTASVPAHQFPTATSIDYTKEKYKYEAYLPYSTQGRQPPLEEFVHVDVGMRADPEKKRLFGVSDVIIQEVTPNVGTEIQDIQLSQLSPEQLDDLALLAAERGVVIFKDQDFADIGPEKQKKYGEHFGHLHVHQMGIHIKDYPQILPVYRDAE
ncbi:Alpha-ketoglutarate-dependent sulfonate dioxygenase [Lachnellula occidentalis]|uniref:Alpha-ketoglutarate-dependent sulfonate dioxygenase n=1 Tax=Lachnellula occidentalis TaxID=215460 RepID=A0A8H8RVG3_9HELO|nr:Alpha-ketoglutarate-dependent sulfonate dioxygenase [Lachnellula occidentalis]